MQTVEMAKGDTHTLRSQTSMIAVETLGTLVGHCSAFSRDETAVDRMRVRRQDMLQDIKSFRTFEFKTFQLAFAFFVMHSNTFKEFDICLAIKRAVLSIQAFLMVAKHTVVVVTVIAYRIRMLHL